MPLFHIINVCWWLLKYTYNGNLGKIQRAAAVLKLVYVFICLFIQNGNFSYIVITWLCNLTYGSIEWNPFKVSTNKAQNHRISYKFKKKFHPLGRCSPHPTSQMIILDLLLFLLHFSWIFIRIFIRLNVPVLYTVHYDCPSMFRVPILHVHLHNNKFWIESCRPVSKGIDCYKQRGSKFSFWNLYMYLCVPTRK